MSKRNQEGDRVAERASQKKEWTREGFRKRRVLGKGGTAKLLMERQRTRMRIRGIVDRIRTLRRQKRLSQAEIARRMVTPPSVVARLETEPVNCTMETILRYADAVGVRILVKATNGEARRARSG